MWARALRFFFAASQNGWCAWDGPQQKSKKRQMYFFLLAPSLFQSQWSEVRWTSRPSRNTCSRRKLNFKWNGFCFCANQLLQDWIMIRTMEKNTYLGSFQKKASGRGDQEGKLVNPKREIGKSATTIIFVRLHLLCFGSNSLFDYSVNKCSE